MSLDANRHAHAAPSLLKTALPGADGSRSRLVVVCSSSIEVFESYFQISVNVVTI